jgi:hypothetical protein
MRPSPRDPDLSMWPDGSPGIFLCASSCVREGRIKMRMLPYRNADTSSILSVSS